jgi:type I restriction enzyme, S subunit
MASWPTIAVSEVCEAIIDCVNKTAPSVAGPTPFRMIRTTNVRDGWVDTESVRYVEESVFQKWIRRGKPCRGDVILTREAPLGAVGMLRDASGVFLGQRLVMYRADPVRLDNRFLLYSFMDHAVQGQIRSYGSGSTVEHMRVPDCGLIEIPYPPLPVQRKIGSVLSAYDDLIENNNRRIKILEEMAQNLYREWFVKFRFPGHENAHMVDSPLGKIPDGWEVCTLSALASYIRRGISPKYSDDSEELVINQRCIRDGRVSLDAARRHSKKVPPDKRVRFGDVLINSTGIGTLGRVAQVYQTWSNCTVDSHVTIARPGGAVAVEFWGASLLELQPHFEQLGTGATGQTELSRTRVGEIEIICPPEKMQHLFAESTGSMRAEVVCLLKKNQALRQTRDLLLPKLISGEVDVSEVETVTEDG